MRGSDLALTVLDWHNMLWDTDAGASVQAGFFAAGVPFWRHVGSVRRWTVRIFGVRKKLNRKRGFGLRPVGRFIGQFVPESCPFPIVVRHLLTHSHLAEQFDYWMDDWEFELRLCEHAKEILKWRTKRQIAGELPAISSVITWRPQAVDKSWIDLCFFIHWRCQSCSIILCTF